MKRMVCTFGELTAQERTWPATGCGSTAGKGWCESWSAGADLEHKGEKPKGPKDGNTWRR
jgi:hypothetical protein